MLNFFMREVKHSAKQKPKNQTADHVLPFGRISDRDQKSENGVSGITHNTNLVHRAIHGLRKVPLFAKF